MLDDGTVSLEAPKGTLITYDGKTVESDGKKPVNISPDLDKRATEAKMDELFHRVPNKGPFYLELEVKLENGKTYEGEVRLHLSAEVRYWVVNKFKNIVEGPVLFGDEKNTGQSKGVLWLTESQVETKHFYGPVKRVSDVGFVVLKSKVHEKRKECGTYVRPGTNETDTYAVVKQDWTMVAYDRFTGEVVEKKTFKGKMPRCPKEIKRGGADFGMPEGKPIQKWILSLSKKVNQ